MVRVFAHGIPTWTFLSEKQFLIVFSLQETLSRSFTSPLLFSYEISLRISWETRTGASVGANVAAHHRVRSRHFTQRADCHMSSLICAILRVWSPYDSDPPRKAGRFTGADFPLQPDGTLRCPAGQVLTAHEQRREVDGSLRVVYGASIRSCRPCPLREQCQWQGSATKKPRQVSMLLHPLTVGPAPLLWRDWSRRLHRRACMHEARVPSASRYRKNPGVLPAHLSCRCPSPEPSEHIPVSAGKNASLAMCALKRRTR